MRGLLSIADSCGPEWGQRAREAVALLLEKERAEHPKIPMIKHGLVIFGGPEFDTPDLPIKSTQFNKELKQLDLPDANWNRYRGPSGGDYAHPISMAEQAALLAEVDIKSERIRPTGKKQCRGYKRAQFQDAWRKHGSTAPDETGSARGRLRLITPSSD